MFKEVTEVDYTGKGGLEVAFLPKVLLISISSLPSWYLVMGGGDEGHGCKNRNGLTCHCKVWRSLGGGGGEDTGFEIRETSF